ncbi:DUF983 domain-containing protein [Mucilaginibacter sp. PAMB04274]|uniref:DUF983 domain-containing protein n=1 Tax=Mucilaginibacter sp. PAMB04274 TaxID=3138568 RepID=UPI0031F62460
MENQEKKPIKMWPAIIQAKCPRCRVGKIYANSMYSFSGQKILQKCPHCGLTYEREPGYFYSAMYVSYAFIVAELVTLGVSASILTGSENPWFYLAVMLSVVLLLAPFNYRYSRVLLLHWLTPGLNYRPDLSS